MGWCVHVPGFKVCGQMRILAMRWCMHAAPANCVCVCQVLVCVKCLSDSMHVDSTGGWSGDGGAAK